MIHLTNVDLSFESRFETSGNPVYFVGLLFSLPNVDSSDSFCQTSSKNDSSSRQTTDRHVNRHEANMWRSGSWQSTPCIGSRPELAAQLCSGLGGSESDPTRKKTLTVTPINFSQASRSAMHLGLSWSIRMDSETERTPLLPPPSTSSISVWGAQLLGTRKWGCGGRERRGWRLIAEHYLAERGSALSPCSRAKVATPIETWLSLADTRAGCLTHGLPHKQAAGCGTARAHGPPDLAESSPRSKVSARSGTGYRPPSTFACASDILSLNHETNDYCDQVLCQNITHSFITRVEFKAVCII